MQSPINSQQPPEQHSPHFSFPSTPWSLESMPWQLASTSVAQPGGVMQFSAAQQQQQLLHQKRKSDIVATEIPSPKQFISEEKITAHFNGLHISSNYIQHTNSDNSEPVMTTGKNFTNLTYEDYQVTAKELAEKLKKASRITLCDEMKQLNEEQRKVPFLPNALVHHMPNPCKALVLWQPPPSQFNFMEQSNDHALSTGSINNETSKNEGEVHQNNEFCQVDLDADIDDFIDNNNTCNVDFNNLKTDDMDEDL